MLSGDAFEGRYPGTDGRNATTAYLVSELQSFGLRPGAARAGAEPGEAWLQAVTIIAYLPDSTSPNEARLSGRITRPLEHGWDLRLTSLSGNADVRAGGELVFVGYGVSAPAYGWDDFRGLDLRGRIAIALLGEPRVPGDSVELQRRPRLALRIVQRQGAGDGAPRSGRGAMAPPCGVALSSAVTGTRRLSGDAVSATLLFSGSLADSTLAHLLPPGTPPLASLVDLAGRPGFRAVPVGVRLDVRFRTQPVTSPHNVVAIVPGRDPRLRNEYVVLSAHWDAYGIGTAVAGDSIYNGALDDGSGVTSLLALARVFAKYPPARSLVFLFTTAEECWAPAHSCAAARFRFPASWPT